MIGFIAAVLLTFLSLGAFAMPAQAAEIPGAISQVTVDPKDPGQYDPMTVGVNWAVPDGAKPGDTFSLQLPPELVALTHSFELKDSSGQVIATAQVVNGVVVFTLTDYVKTHKNVQGVANFKTQFSKKVTPEQPIALDFGPAGKVTVTPSGDSPRDRNQPIKYGYWVDRSGNYSAAPTNRIRWVIESPRGAFNNALFEDQLGAGQRNDCSSLVGGVSTGFDANGEVSGWAGVPAGGLTVNSCTANAFSVNIASIPQDKIVSLSYIAEITDPAQSSFTNAADVTVDGEKLHTEAELVGYQAGGNGKGELTDPVTPPTPVKPTPAKPVVEPSPVVPTSPAVVKPAGGSTPTPAAEGELANTGPADALPLLGVASLAILAGAGALLLSRRRAH